MAIGDGRDCGSRLPNAKVFPPDADYANMIVSNSAATSLLDSVLRAETTRVDVSVAVLDKAQESQQQQGEAMVKLIEQAGAVATPQGFSAYA